MFVQRHTGVDIPTRGNTTAQYRSRYRRLLLLRKAASKGGSDKAKRAGTLQRAVFYVELRGWRKKRAAPESVKVIWVIADQKASLPRSPFPSFPLPLKVYSCVCRDACVCTCLPVYLSVSACICLCFGVLNIIALVFVDLFLFQSMCYLKLYVWVCVYVFISWFFIFLFLFLYVSRIFPAEDIKRVTLGKD